MEYLYEIRRLLHKIDGNDSQKIILTYYIPDLINLIMENKLSDREEIFYVLEKIKREINLT